MRFIVLSVIFCLAIVNSNGQRFSSPRNPKPDYALPSVYSNRPSALVESTTQPGVFRRILNWFNPNQRQSQPAVADSLTSADFDDPMPKESTDRMINDAISDRILEESREQQIVHSDGPFINDKANDKSFEYHESSASEHHNQIVEPNSTSNREGYGKAAQADTIPITEALRIVNSANLTDCVARVICELSCNANAYGNAGRIVFRNMIKLQFDQTITGEDAKFFRGAAAKGLCLK